MNHWRSTGALVENLATKQLLDPSSVTDGTFTIYDLSSRNRNYLVQQHQPLFVKIGLDEQRQDTLRGEAEIYQTMRTRASQESFLPALRHFDPSDGVMITEGLTGSIALYELFHEPNNTELEKAGELLGKAMSRIAQTEVEWDHTGRDYAPWPFTLAAPALDSYVNFSSAAQELIRLLQQNLDYAKHLEQLRNSWRNNGFIHNDLKPDNVLFTSAEGQGVEAVRIIDWEMSGLGDTDWDVGTLWASVVKIWVDSAERPGEPGMKLRRKPEALFAFNRSFWAAYTAKMPQSERLQRTLRTVQFAGVGLLKAVIEQAEMTHTPTRSHLLYLQVSHNLILNASQAANTLLGIL